MGGRAEKIGTIRSRAARPKGRATAERILDAAEALFAQHGYAGTTLRDVAAAVGIRNPSLYNHFESKESLYGAVLERGTAPVLEALSEFVESGEAAEASSRELIERMIGLLAERKNLVGLIQHETLSGGHLLTDMLRDRIAPIFARAGEIVESNPAAARWQPEQIPLFVLAMYHVIVGYFAIAPMYGELTGEDLTSSSALQRQTRFVGDLIESFLGDAKTSPDRGATRGR